jgi:hypothetical protein
MIHFADECRSRGRRADSRSAQRCRRPTLFNYALANVTNSPDSVPVRDGRRASSEESGEHEGPYYVRVLTSSSRERRWRSKARSRFGLVPENSRTP